jgi:hypothetical protein
MTAARRRASTRVLGASLEAPAATHWAISERDGGCSIAVSAEATAAARSLLGLGVDQGPIDVNVLPLLADLNIGAGETAGDVAVDVARLALKHRLGLAQGEARAITRREPGAVARLASTLDIGARAVTASLQPIGIDDDVRAVLAHLRQAHAAALGWGRGEREQLASRGEHINALLDRYTRSRRESCCA